MPRWERFVSKYHKKVILIDDLNNKEHFSDYIINYELGRIKGSMSGSLGSDNHTIIFNYYPIYII